VSSTPIVLELEQTPITLEVVVGVASSGGAVTSVDGLTGAVVLSSSYQPLDADLTALAGVSTTGLLRRTGAGTASAGTVVSIAEGGTGQTSAGAALSALGGQASDAGLTSLAALPTVADRYAYSAAADVWAEGTITTAGRAILDDADASAQRTTLGLAAVASSGSASDLATGTLPIARIADAAVTYAKVQNVSATDKVLGRSTAGAGVVEEIACTSAARQVLAAADLAAIRVLLGIPEILLSSAWSNATQTLSDITGLSFTPAANGVYLVEVRGAFTAASNGTGFQWLISPGNGTGGGFFASRGSSSTAQAILIGTLDGSSDSGGATSPSTPGDECGFHGFAIVTAGASPTAIVARGKSELVSEVAIAANHAMMTYRRLA